MTSTSRAAEILKQDERGRVRVTVARRESLLDEFEKSGLSGAKFARLSGIKYPTFANWVARRRRGRAVERPGANEAGHSNGEERPIRLFEAVVEKSVCGTAAGGADHGLVVELPGGSRVLIGSAMQLQLAAELVVLVAQGRRSPC